MSVFIPETPNTLLVSVSFCTVCADWIGKRVVDNWPHSGIKPKLTQQSLRSLCFPHSSFSTTTLGVSVWCLFQFTLYGIHLPFFLVVFCFISGSCCCLSAKLTTVILLCVGVVALFALCCCCCGWGKHEKFLIRMRDESSSNNFGYFVVIDVSVWSGLRRILAQELND